MTGSPMVAEEQEIADMVAAGQVDLGDAPVASYEDVAEARLTEPKVVPPEAL